MPATNYLQNHVIDSAYTGRTSFTMPVVYVGLSSTTPTAAGGSITEPSSGAYARVATTGSTWNAAALGVTTNALAITFPTATGDWSSGANQTYMVGFDASTGGNALWDAALTAAKNVLSGDTPSFAAGQISITLT